MFSRIEALNFRCLRSVARSLGPFHVLVGPNGSGKSTFLDVIAFARDLVSRGLESAVSDRTNSFQDLVWCRSGNRFELAIEATIPKERRQLLADKIFDTVRYEIAIGLESTSGELSILAEKALLKVQPKQEAIRRQLFPEAQRPPKTLLSPKPARASRTLINKVPGGNDNFYSETYESSGKGWVPTFKLGPRKSALANLPEDESKFPVTTWLKRALSEGVESIQLNSQLLRRASPPGQTKGFRTDGSNLPWVIESLRSRSQARFDQWIRHLQGALPDLVTIRTIERKDDKNRYLMLAIRGGLEVPSWMVSDGTLRLLALTLPAYLEDFQGVYLIEEPENGIHPRAVETMFQSLASAYDAQVLLATHSPVILSTASADTVLCFAKGPDGATDIVLGTEHPALSDWRGEENLGVLFAAGVLG